MSKQKQIERSETQHYVSQRKKRGQQPAKLQPPLTPMIDVTFQLLLYFLLTAEFREEEGGIPGTLPNKGGIVKKKEDPRKPIRVEIEPAGEFSKAARFVIGNRPPTVDRDELQRILMGEREAAGDDPPALVIQPHGGVRWQYVVEVFNAAARARFEEIGWVRTGA
jgi:biopolymer transport protein ExbD